ncbi:MAG: hypothetical protein U0L92_05500 [Clostridia bacterium]|nr:hypothetical protein [Clostridia bacterium]
MEKIKRYVEFFNQNDNELYINKIDNAHALQWLEEEIPIFECPDKELEETYYFRWWTYRKHLRETADDGYVITEFLPDVPWSGKYNVINAAVGHHLTEGRWLKNAKTYLTDYIKFFLNHTEDSHRYSSWMLTAILDFYRVVGQMPKDKELVRSMCDYYEEWERTHQLPNGMFWSYDDRDAMEYSVSGTKDMQHRKGIRPTLNAYMCADANALAIFAEHADMPEVAKAYRQKHETLKNQILENLWDRDFFKAFHYDGEASETAFDGDKDNIPRELIGYIPWCFDIPTEEQESAFSYLESNTGFFTEYGLTTVEQSDPRFLFEVDHECLWNGYIWPFATSQTLMALNHHCDKNPKYRALFQKLLKQYALCHRITTEDGKTIPWIDEVKHPYRDEWTSRTLLKEWGWKEELGGMERGKDYNHSTFCDLVICGIVGIDPKADYFAVNPNIPEDWDYMKLDRLYFRGSCYTVIYDKTGEKYGLGKGLTVYKDGRKLTFK